MGSLTVLVVDDEPAEAEHVAEAIQRVDDRIEATPVTDPDEAVARVENGGVECVVCDYRLNGTDGLELLAAVRETDPEAPFILLTGAGDEGVASEAVSAGVSDYLLRDAEPEWNESLVNRIENVVARREAERRDSRRAQHELEADLRVQKEKIETLHEVAQEIETAETEQQIYDLAIEAAESVLEFDMCIIDAVDGRRLVPVAVSTEMPASGYESSTVEDGVAGKVVRTGESSLIDDVQNHPDATPESDAFHSAISVPIGDVGLFQAVASERNEFDEDDLELAELLCSHVREAVVRLRSEADLREERDRFAALFENVPDAMVRCHVTPEGEAIVRDVNPAFESTFGFEAAAIEGEPLDDFVMPSGRREEGQQYNLMALEDGVETTEVVRRTADGERDFLVRPIPIETDRAEGIRAHEAVDAERDDGDEEEGPAGELYVVYTDISDQKARERQLTRQNERLDEFASVVSHDLRNPLNVAQGRLDLARERGEPEDYEEIEIALDRMADLIEGLLQLAREGQVTAEPERVDLAGVARAAWLPDSDDATLDVAPGLPTVVADPTRLPDLFANLFRNAVDHCGGDVRVEVGALEDGFYVADDGPGIDPDDRERVFEAGHTTEEAGTGFGLAIVDRIAEAHGWEVEVCESDAGGARFEFHDVDLAP